MLIIDTQKGNNNKHSGGLPHSEIHGSKLILSSPWLIAEYHVFHRLLLPRHSPNALFALDLIQKKPDLRQRCQAGSSRHLFLWSKVILFPLKHTYMFEHLNDLTIVRVSVAPIPERKPLNCNMLHIRHASSSGGEGPGGLALICL